MCWYKCSCGTCFHTSQQLSTANPLQKALVFGVVAADLRNEFVQVQKE